MLSLHVISFLIFFPSKKVSALVCSAKKTAPQHTTNRPTSPEKSRENKPMQRLESFLRVSHIVGTPSDGGFERRLSTPRGYATNANRARGTLHAHQHQIQNNNNLNSNLNSLNNLNNLHNMNNMNIPNNSLGGTLGSTGSVNSLGPSSSRITMREINHPQSFAHLPPLRVLKLIIKHLLVFYMIQYSLYS